ncbi:MAG: hypothetical protein ABW170_13340 [Candidatus Thiodiazotropha sp. L084R]
MVDIAGNKTDTDWKLLESQIRNDFNNVDLWNQALDIFELRLNERYINPAEIIQNNLSVTGEGFSIITLLCSLIEALETFHEGKCYKYEKPRTNTEYGNGKSQSLFVKFLTKRQPFSNIFDEELAKDFYKNIRCALLHEAMTKNGWTIRIDTDVLVERIGDGKVLNRFYMLEYFKQYIKGYRENILCSKKRKNAFIRKMNCICKNA